MKIGILCRDFNLLKNWELRIINELMSNPSFTLSLIIKDGREPGISGDKLASKNSISGFLLNTQAKIESKLFQKTVSVNKKEIINFLDHTDTITLYPQRENSFDVFSKEDSDKIKKYELDVILKHGFAQIKGDILNSSKHGIWEVLHSDNRIIRNCPVGFWEIYSNQTCIGVTLIRLTPGPQEESIIERGFYINDYSFIRSRNLVYEYSVNLLLKNLNLLNKYKTIEFEKPQVFDCKYNGMPNVLQISKYIFRFHIRLIRNAITKKIDKIAIKIGKRPKCWALFTSKGTIFNTDLKSTTLVKPHKNEFWADPFIFKHNNKDYLIYENYEYDKDKGIISCGILEDNKISEVQNILSTNYHLSYPFIYENNEGIFMIPETNQNKRLEVYKSKNFPFEWELYATAFEGEHITDPTIYTDSYNNLWLFLNKSILPVTDNNSELYIYKIDSLKLNEIIPHKKNPVIIDCRIGRNGGAIFKDRNRIIRPSQYNNFYGSYGYGLNLSIIKTLTLDDYEEELIKTIRPDFRKGLIGIHHLCQREDRFVVDGRFRFL